MTQLDLITGFLGAGKTTFIKKYAKYHMEQGERVAVIENEFGASGIDTAILKNDDIEVEQLTGGCICCTQKVNFHNLIISLAKDYDRIIVEPSGIFSIDDFFEIIYSPLVKKVCELTNIITIADPGNLNNLGAEATHMLYLQMAFAGKILLSKTGTMTQQAVAAAKLQIEAMINEYVEIEGHKENDSVILTMPWESFSNKDYKELSQCGYTLFAHTKRSLDHTAIFNSTTLYPSPINKEELIKSIKIITDGSCGEILRIKGYVMTKEDNCLEVNCTAKDISIKETDKKETPVLNIIGKNINRKQIKEFL